MEQKLVSNQSHLENSCLKIPPAGHHGSGEMLTDYIQVSWGGSILSTRRIVGKINQMSESEHHRSESPQSLLMQCIGRHNPFQWDANFTEQMVWNSKGSIHNRQGLLLLWWLSCQSLSFHTFPTKSRHGTMWQSFSRSKPSTGMWLHNLGAESGRGAPNTQKSSVTIKHSSSCQHPKI